MSDSAIAPASASMCAASDSSARECTTLADNDLDGREADDERERDGQLAAVGVGGEAVSVPGVTPPSAWSCPWA